MACYDEFPVSTVIYNGVTAGGVLALGVAISVQFGLGVLIGYVLLVAVAMMGVLGTVCARCESYYGRRCGLGLGSIVSVLFKQKQTELYLRTPMQFVYLVLFLAAMVWPIVGGAILLAGGFSVWRLVQLIATVVLLLALGVPHPKLVCSHCRQGECGGCPVGRMLRKV